MSDPPFTTTIDSQQIVFEFHGADPEPLKAAFNELQDLLQAALKVQASLTMQKPENRVEVGLKVLQDWLRDRSFDVSVTDVLNDLLSESNVRITEFAIAPSGQFAIALHVKFQDPFTSENLSPEIRQIIQGPEVGLGLSRVV